MICQCVPAISNPDKDHFESGQLMPVVFYIHGGGYANGENTVDMDNFIDAGGVVFAVSYRLGIWGFLWSPTADEDGKHGNWGLLDQRLGMEWVQKHGHLFGGDTGHVTLTGCSAGSESILWHMTSPMSWPYFQAVASVGIGLNVQWETELATVCTDST